jgi:F-type H+-transporting ATPase subunit gamma
MAGAKEIRSKISSVKNTQKITKAMEMVAASKMRKAQDRMRAARPYADRIRSVIGHLRRANPDYQHPFLVDRPRHATGIIVVSTDRGLCGSLNINLFKAALGVIREAQGRGETVHVSVVGTKAQLIGTIKVMLDAYRAGSIDRLLLLNNVFVNTMSQKPTVTQLLPVEASEQGELQQRWDYIYEPSAAELLDGILNRYVESQVYRGAVENVACEMAARMVAMKSASDNAGNLIEELQLIYNKARQAAITKELTEIVGGAAAV